MKKVSHISRKELNLFSKNDLDFISHQENLKDFIGLPFTLDNVQHQIDFKKNSFSNTHRNILAQELSKKYQKLNKNENALEQIQCLEEDNTFTITTGHQLCLLGGPMYFFLKIIHVIKLSNSLNKKYPKYHFIPVFWMASEDHDSAEIDHLHLFNKKIQWKHSQEGAVGRFKLRGLESVFNELLSLSNEANHEELTRIFNSFDGATYGDAFMSWLHELFNDKGLLIIDGDNKELKTLFNPIIKKELSHSFSHKSVLLTNKRLQVKERKIQVHSREINLFSLRENERYRIIKNQNSFEIGSQTYSLDELLKMVNESPEQFSPNAILRPLYQECILPNICYVGGIAEMNYWAQLKGVFEECDIPYPLLQFRANLLWIDLGANKKIKSTGLQLQDLFKSSTDIKKEFVAKMDSKPIEEKEIEQGLEQIEKSLKEASSDQKNLESWIGSELKKIEKSISHIKSKIIKEKKKSHEDDLIRIEKIKETLFPANQLQERQQNLLHFCNRNGYHEVINDLFMAIDPLNDGFTIIAEENDPK